MNAMRADRFCIFCGGPPVEKNNEHPLPRWLLEYTGDAARVVKHGVAWKSGRFFEFSWDSLKFPACQSCNDRYSQMEGETKPVVEKICERKPTDPAEYVLLLDWLDKVRTGLWLGNRYLQGLSALRRNFTIDGRIGKKDRMVAVYAIGDHQVGLNTYGAETRFFMFQPSVFALRVNNTLFLNASWDWMCSENCGYPYPRTCDLLLDREGRMEVGDFHARRVVTHPIMPGLIKPCVLLFQPILHRGIDGALAGVTDADLDYCPRGAWPGRDDAGVLYRQFDNRTTVYGAASPPIVFDRVTISEARRAIDIATQAYELQIESAPWSRALSEDEERLAAHEKQYRQDVDFNRKVVSTLRAMTPEDLLKAYGKDAARP